VERPLTGPGGQLDTNGNLRAPIAATPARLRARPAGPKNGKIAFVDRTNALEVINPNGSALRRLARCPVAITSCVIGGYAWSPNGKQLAFLRGHAGGAITANDLSLYVINADGTGTRRLAHCGNCDQWSPVAWSPDGSSIVFAGDDGLHLISASTGTQVHLTHSGTDVDPAWSPNGSTIAFVRGDSLYAIRSDGSAIAELAPADAIRHPAWAPDETKIAFDGHDQIYVVGAHGSQLKLLRGGSLGSGPGTPSWSPDGEHILFFNTPGTPGAFTAEVWVMRPDGSDQRRLYHSRCCVGEWYAPIWSPNGKSIAFSGDSAGGIFLMNANGSHRRRLSQSATEIAWQSIP
jgi:Tol biopolymer transport system component